MITADRTRLLRDAGLRVTTQRLAVYDEVIRQPHADTEAIAAGARIHLGVISTQAVYDVLRALTAARLVRRIQPTGSPARFEARVGDNHHHVVCRQCGALSDVDCAVGAAPCLQASDDDGFAIDEAEVIYWGLCPACQSAMAAAPPSTPATSTTPLTSSPANGGTR